jgi:hypothetical protein
VGWVGGRSLALREWALSVAALPWFRRLFLGAKSTLMAERFGFSGEATATHRAGVGCYGLVRTSGRMQFYEVQNGPIPEGCCCWRYEPRRLPLAVLFVALEGGRSRLQPS